MDRAEKCCWSDYCKQHTQSIFQSLLSWKTWTVWAEPKTDKEDLFYYWIHLGLHVPIHEGKLYVRHEPIETSQSIRKEGLAHHEWDWIPGLDGDRRGPLRILSSSWDVSFWYQQARAIARGDEYGKRCSTNKSSPSTAAHTAAMPWIPTRLGLLCFHSRHSKVLTISHFTGFHQCDNLVRRQCAWSATTLDLLQDQIRS